MNSQYVDVPIFNALIPKEGPKAVPIPLNFVGNSTQAIDLLLQEQTGDISAVQSLFIDNQYNSVPLYVAAGGNTSQVLVCPAYSQGYFALLQPSPIKLTAMCPGGTNAVVILLNIPVSNQVWSINGQATVTGGKMSVSDAILEGAVSGNLFQCQQYIQGSNGESYPARVGNAVAVGSINASTGAIITGAPGYFITGAAFSLSPGAVQAAAGDWTVSLVDSSFGAIWESSFYVPGAAPTLTAAAHLGDETYPGYGWNNGVVDSTLSVTLSAALTAGHLIYKISYGIAASVG